jgi:hypothetical protein
MTRFHMQKIVLPKHVNGMVGQICQVQKSRSRNLKAVAQLSHSK